MAAAAGVCCAAVATFLVLEQHQSLTALRSEVANQKAQNMRLAAQALFFSNSLNRMSVPVHLEEPPPGLLKLRGEIAVLRRQLSEVQQSARETNLGSAEVFSPMYAQHLRTRGETACLRLKALCDQLRDKQASADTDGFVQQISAILPHDSILISLQEKRAQALQALTDPGLEPDQREALNQSVSEISKKISDRANGMLQGLDTEQAALKELFDRLDNTSGDERMRLVVRILDFVSAIEE